jgi:uroporphyrinogen decarboxylase
MTGREVARMALELDVPPRRPVTLIAGGEWYVHQAGETFADIVNDAGRIARVFVEAFRRVGQDLMWTGAGLLNYPAHFVGCPIRDDSSDTPALLGSAISSPREFSSLDAGQALRQPRMQAITRSHHMVADAIGKETLIAPTQWGPFTTAARILGVEGTMAAAIEDPDGLLDLLRFSTEFIWAAAEPILDHPDVLGINLSDPVASGDMISPSTFRRFVKPFLQELVSRARAMGKYAMLHICGNTTRILEDVLEIGPHCFSLESKVDLRAARKVLGGKICVAGNVSPTGAFLTGSPDEVREEALHCLEAWGAERGFILTLGCDFSKAVPLENVLALMSMKGSL